MEKSLRYPRSRIEKLGVKEGHRVFIDGVDDPALAGELEGRGAKLYSRRPKEADVIFFQARALRELAKLEALKGLLAQDGMIWAIWPKGKKELREDDIRARAIEVGLVDVKVMAFSEVMSGLKLVIPVKARSSRST
jgi:hypothetical protein